jgi:hypothetical protein
MSDTHYSNVSLLLPMNGENNGTVFTDYSPTNKVINRFGDTKTATAQSRFYGSSGLFDGSGDYLTLPASDEFDFGTGNFTMELWVRFNALSTARALIDKYLASNNATWQLYWRATGTSIAFWADESVLLQDPDPNRIAIDNWYHVAVSRSGTTARLFVDGTEVASATLSNNLNNTAPLGIAGQVSGAMSFLNGYIQDLRITKGVARYTADFTPPTRMIGTVSGVITDASGAPCQRKVFAVTRPQGTTAPKVLSHGQSDPLTGYYELHAPYAHEVSRIVLDDAAGTLYNDLIDRVIPG